MYIGFGPTAPLIFPLHSKEGTPMGTGSSLNQETINVCKQELVIKDSYTYFNPSNKQLNHCINNIVLYFVYTVCPTRYRNRHFFNNFTTNEDNAAPCRNN